MKMITVIIPCYNAENTIIRCLMSLERQIYKNFSVVVINDGSVDNTKDILSEYANNSVLDINIIDQKNSGVSEARNNAINSIESRFITFLDADDEYEKDYLNVLFRCISNNNIDLVCTTYIKVKTQNDDSIYHSVNPIQIMNKYEMFEYYIHRKKNKINMWCGIYKTDIIKNHNIFFDKNIKYGEDTLFFYQYLKYCDQGCWVLSNYGYKYYINNLSVMHKCSEDRTHNVYAHMKIANYWNDEKINSDLVKYMVNRAIWALCKDFSFYRRLQLYRKIQKEFSVYAAMKDMLYNGDEAIIKISSGLYLINKYLFFYAFAIIGIVNKLNFIKQLKVFRWKEK